jgi:hypothetical protein
VATENSRIPGVEASLHELIVMLRKSADNSPDGFDEMW